MNEEDRNVLRARARALASVETPQDTPRGMLHVVEFSLAPERYAIESSAVREVQPLVELTPLPCTPPHVAGLINVRGRILGVIDLRRLFGEPGDYAAATQVVIIRGRGLEFGILADRVLGVCEVASDTVQSPPPTLTGPRGAYVKGVTADRLAILDADKMLTDGKLMIDEEARQP
jgi:purine-binding chemotaxis protein CheW